jgi:transketolase
LGALADAAERPPVVKLAVHDMPGSGKPDELMHTAGIDAEAIVEAVRKLAAVGSPA